MTGNWRGRKALITGGLGFIGSNLVRRLVAEEADVLVIDALLPEAGGDPSHLAGVGDDVRWLPIDLRNRRAVAETLRDVQYIFSLAGASRHWESVEDPLRDLELNARAHLTLLEACRMANRHARIVYTGTRQVYGRPEYLPVDERHPLRPLDINGVHEVAAESYYRLYHELHGLRSVCLRLTNTYGPRMNLRADCHGFVAAFVRRALLGQPLELYDGGHQIRDFNHVDDVVDALLRAAQLPLERHEVFNLGADRPYAVRDVAEILQDVTGCDIRETSFPAHRKAIDIGNYRADTTAFRTATGWQARVELQPGLENTVEFFQRSETWRSRRWKLPAPATTAAACAEAAARDGQESKHDSLL